MIYNISNLFSLSRIFLLIPFYYSYAYQKETENEDIIIYNLLFALFIGFTDVLDGYFARKLNQISELGKILDPIADKIAIAFFSLLFYYFDNFPLWLIILLISRDILIVAGAGMLMNRIKEVPSSEWSGKLTTASFGLLFIVYLIQWDAAKEVLFLLTVFFLAYSLLDYIMKFIRLKKSKV